MPDSAAIAAAAKALHELNCAGDCSLKPGYTGMPVSTCDGEPSDAEFDAAAAALEAAIPLLGQFVITVKGGQKLVVPAGLVYEDITEAAEVADKANRRAGLTGREGGYGVARLIPIDDPENEEIPYV